MTAPFTDDDLKRLKEVSRIHGDCEGECLLRPLSAKEVCDLIARLEAAEECVSIFESLLLDLSDGAEITNDAILAWRKAKGDGL